MVQRRVLQCGLCWSKEKCLKPGLKCVNGWSSSTVQRKRVPESWSSNRETTSSSVQVVRRNWQKQKLLCGRPQRTRLTVWADQISKVAWLLNGLLLSAFTDNWIGKSPLCRFAKHRSWPVWKQYSINHVRRGMLKTGWQCPIVPKYICVTYVPWTSRFTSLFSYRWKKGSHSSWSLTMNLCSSSTEKWLTRSSSVHSSASSSSLLSSSSSSLLIAPCWMKASQVKSDISCLSVCLCDGTNCNRYM